MGILNVPSVTDLLKAFVAVDTQNPPGNEGNLVSTVQEFLRPFPVELEQFDIGESRENLVALVRAKNPLRAPLILNGHLDTVHASGDWLTDPFDLMEQDGVFKGLGAADMKGALACQASVLIHFSQRPEDLRQDLWLVWTAGEEVDCIGAREIAPVLRNKPWSGIVVGEPTMNQVTTAQKGALWVQLDVPGRAAHGAYPERGFNAIRYTADIVNRIAGALEGTYDHPLLGATTVNWASMNAGVQANIVPDSARALLDIRFAPPLSKEHILATIETAILEVRHTTNLGTVPGDVTVSIVNARAPFDTPTTDPFVTEALGITGQGSPIGMRAYTDGSVFSREIMCPVVILGPGDIAQAHAANEMITGSQLYEAVEIYTRLAGRTQE